MKWIGECMKKKITIGLFIDTFYPMVDGVIMVVDNYAKRLSKVANVYVFAPKIPWKRFDDSKFDYKVIRCHSLKVPMLDYSLPVPKIDPKFKKTLDECNLDIIHIHSPMTLGKIGVQYAKERNIPVIATMHSQYKQDFYRATHSKKLSNQITKQIIKVYEQCDECWTVNQEVARIFHEDYGYSKLPIIKNNATEMKPVKDLEKSKERINKLHNLKEEKVLLFVGRINKLKNVFFIMNSLKEIKNLDYKMLFVGTGQDEEDLKELMYKKHLEDKVIFVGKVTNRDLMADYYARADLFLFPSLYDANSIVQIEAASQKTPVLFLENAATACNIKNNHNGYLSANNIKEYAKRIEEIFEDTKKYKSVCENAYKELYRNWDDEVKDIYESYLEWIRKKEQ